MQSKGRLTRTERQELRTLQRDERRNAQQNLTADQQKTAATGNQQRIQELQSKGRLTRNERRELRQLQRDERQNARLQERQQQTQQQQNSQAAADRQSRRAQRQAVSAQQVSQGRFASNLSANHHGRRAARRAARLAALTAWQLGVLAPYVPWRGPVYWPYAYNDVFYYTFWPEAYDSAYWAYAYDDFFDGVFFPDGAPYVEYAAEGPYDGAYARTATNRFGSARRRSAPSAPGRINQATRDFCADQATGVTAWPLDKIADAVQPTSEQRTLLENLRKASQEAAAQFRESRRRIGADDPAGPPAGHDPAAAGHVRLDKHGEAGARSVLQFAQRRAEGALQRDRPVPCRGRSARSAPPRRTPSKTKTHRPIAAARRPAFPASPSTGSRTLVQPTEAQDAALDRLDEAMQKAIDILRETCPNTVAMTPVGRLEAMKQRLDAMIQAANAVRPALEDFYASLTDEQKAKFNQLGRQTAQSGG